jgi:hypothetical protein
MLLLQLQLLCMLPDEQPHALQLQRCLTRLLLLAALLLAAAACCTAAVAAAAAGQQFGQVAAWHA